MGEMGFKGFSKGLVCKGKQYQENTVFEEKEAKICSKGMHYCKNPFDVLDYYGFLNDKGEFNDFAIVEPMAEEFTDDNKKYCTSKLKIGAKLSFKGFVKACVDFVIEKTTFEAGENNSSGYYAQIGSSGDSAKIGSSGYYAQIESTGMYSVICCAGHGSIAKAKKGSFITLAEWQYSEELERYIPINVETKKVDGVEIKEDIFYKLVEGKFVEIV